MPSEHVDAGWGRSAPTFAYLAATGPAYLAIQHIGAEACMAAARAAAASLYVEGIGVRAEVELQCLVGEVPS